MRLREYAEMMGVKYQTALKWIKRGTIKDPYEQLPSGTYVVFPENRKKDNSEVVIYARVSTYHQKEDLNRQVERLEEYAKVRNWKVLKVVKEIASGLNDKRKKINKILRDPNIKNILVEDRDRLSRFGVTIIESTLEADHRHLLVMNSAPKDVDFMQDFIDVVICMCSRIYGLRSSRNRAKLAYRAVEEYNDD